MSNHAQGKLSSFRPFKAVSFIKIFFRCIFTNVDPHTAERDSKEEPLKTLKSYRKFEKTGDSPVMGVHLGLRREGQIKVGDSVYVEDA
jgi:uncharacterized protein YcbX